MIQGIETAIARYENQSSPEDDLTCDENEKIDELQYEGWTYGEAYEEVMKDRREEEEAHRESMQY